MGMNISRLALLWRRQPALPEGWRLQGRLTARPCRVVLDDSLLKGCRTVTQILLPLSPAPRLSLRAGSGTLLLAAAMTVMADTVPDEAALLSLAATLGFTPDRFLRGCPVLAEAALGSVPGRVVRDGKGRRAYFLGSPATLAPLCRRIWDGGERPMTGDDLQRLPCHGGAQYALATAPMDGDTPGEATYLGSLRVEDAPCPAMLAALEALRSQGMEVIPRRGAATLREGDLPVAAASDAGTCLIPPAPDAAGLDAAVEALLLHTRQAEDHLRAVGQLMALILVCWLAMGVRPYALLLYLPMCTLFAFLGCDTLSASLPWSRRLGALVLPCLIGALTRGFLGLVLSGDTHLAMACCLGSMCITLVPPMVFEKRRPKWIFTALIMVLMPLVSTLLYHAGLEAAFANLSGSLCAVVYRCLLGEE